MKNSWFGLRYNAIKYFIINFDVSPSHTAPESKIFTTAPVLLKFVVLNFKITLYFLITGESVAYDEHIWFLKAVTNRLQFLFYLSFCFLNFSFGPTEVFLKTRKYKLLLPANSCSEDNYSENIPAFFDSKLKLPHKHSYSQINRSLHVHGR